MERAIKRAHAKGCTLHGELKCARLADPLHIGTASLCNRNGFDPLDVATLHSLDAASEKATGRWLIAFSPVRGQLASKKLEPVPFRPPPFIRRNIVEGIEELDDSRRKTRDCVEHRQLRWQ